jgi:hypothetical protein
MVVADSASFDLGSVLTVSAWVKTDVTTRQTILGHIEGTGYWQFEMDAQGDGSFGITTPGMWTAYTYSGHFTSGSWVYLTVTRSGTGTGTTIPYVNAEAKSLWNDAGNDFVDPSEMNFGKRTTGTQWLDGVLDEVRISSVARSAAWIAYEYANMNAADGGLTWGAAQSLARNLLKSVSVNPSGAGATPEVVAGTWSAEIANPGGIFHPFHPTSAYADYFRVGRKVRISIGGVYGGTAYYWQRIIGYMDAPTFNNTKRQVSLSGMDYMKSLADTALRSPGNYWGATATYSTVASVMVLGSEIYNEADAMEIEHEANNVASWVVTDGTFESFASGGGGSTYVGLLQPIDETDAPVTYDNDVGSFTIGVTYVVSFKYKRTSPWTPGTELSCYIYESGTVTVWGSIANLKSATWATASFSFVCPKTTTARMTFKMSAQYKAGAVDIQVDRISIKPQTGDAINAPYELPTESNGPCLAVLDGAAIWFGQANDEWTFDEATNLLTFSEKKIMAAGTDNLVIYYFTTQTLENVAADILANGPDDLGGGAGLYANRAAALAAMDYTPTGITIPRVWFDAGMPILDAIRKICERCNYRFWFDELGVPHFKPAPTAGTADFAFESFGDLAGLDDHQDLEQLRNRIVIDGAEQAMYAPREDRDRSRLTGSAYDQASIDTYKEHTEPIRNHLFQDQASLNAMCATLLAARKDPKWYASLTVPHCAVPLEVGDCIAWNIAFQPGGAEQTVTGIIVGIELQNAAATYTCEIWQSPPLSSPPLSSPLRYPFRLFPGPRFLGLNT